MNKLPNKKEVNSALDALGNTVDAVARNLYSKGIRGCASKANNCPIAIYLNKCFPGYTFSTLITVISWIEEKPSLYPKSGSIETPMIINFFIKEFDAGLYPSLKLL